jgi:hypothetical protein
MFKELLTYAPIAPLITASAAVIALCLSLGGVLIAWQSHKERIVSDYWRDFDKTSIDHADLYVAAHDGTFDFQKFTLDGSAEKFQKYVWYVSYLVFCIEKTLRLRRSKGWNIFFLNQIRRHRRFFASDYCRTQFLPVLSPELRSLIEDLAAPVEAVTATRRSEPVRQ